MFWFLANKTCGILVPQSGLEPAPPVIDGEVLNPLNAWEVPVCFFKVSQEDSLKYSPVCFSQPSLPQNQETCQQLQNPGIKVPILNSLSSQDLGQLWKMEREGWGLMKWLFLSPRHDERAQGWESEERRDNVGQGRARWEAQAAPPEQVSSLLGPRDHTKQLGLRDALHCHYPVTTAETGPIYTSERTNSSGPWRSVKSLIWSSPFGQPLFYGLRHR